MTILLTIISVIGLIFACWLMAKYNKNDNLFWILLISLFAGMAGGAIFNKLSNKEYEETISNFEQVYNPMQVSPAISIGFYAEPGDSFAFMAEPASQEIETPARDIKVSYAPSEVYGEIRGQPDNFNPFHLGNPGYPYDTS